MTVLCLICFTMLSCLLFLSAASIIFFASVEWMAIGFSFTQDMISLIECCDGLRRMHRIGCTNNDRISFRWMAHHFIKWSIHLKFWNWSDGFHSVLWMDRIKRLTPPVRCISCTCFCEIWHNPPNVFQDELTFLYYAEYPYTIGFLRNNDDSVMDWCPKDISIFSCIIIANNRFRFSMNKKFFQIK